MNKNNIDFEINRTMESLDNIGKADMPSHLEMDFLARLDRVQREDRSRTKWFWAAAVVLFIINATVAFNYSGTKSETASTTSVNSSAPTKSTFTDFYYGNSNSLYQ